MPERMHDQTYLSNLVLDQPVGGCPNIFRRLCSSRIASLASTCVSNATVLSHMSILSTAALCESAINRATLIRRFNISSVCSAVRELRLAP